MALYPLFKSEVKGSFYEKESSPLSKKRGKSVFKKPADTTLIKVKISPKCGGEIRRRMYIVQCTERVQ